MEAKLRSEKAKNARNVGVRLTNTGAFYRISLVTSSDHCISQSSPPEFEHSQGTPPPQISQGCTSGPQQQRHDGSPLQRNHLGSELPTGPSEVDIELNGMSARGEDPPPPDEEVGDSRTQSIQQTRNRSCFSLSLGGISVFLGPVNMVLGMAASHGDNWKLAFIG